MTSLHYDVITICNSPTTAVALVDISWQWLMVTCTAALEYRWNKLEIFGTELELEVAIKIGNGVME